MGPNSGSQGDSPFHHVTGGREYGPQQQRQQQGAVQQSAGHPRHGATARSVASEILRNEGFKVSEVAHDACMGLIHLFDQPSLASTSNFFI